MESQLDVVRIQMKHDRTLYSNRKVTGPQDAIDLVADEIRDCDRECVVVMSLQSDGRPINVHFCSMGNISSALARPADLFKSLILSNAAGVLLLHIHPSGCCMASYQDINLTKRFKSACDILGFELFDHVIVGDSSNLSMREQGLAGLGVYSSNMQDMCCEPKCGQMYGICPDCANNVGGACVYDMELEAKEQGVAVNELCNKDFCLCREEVDE